MKFHIFLCFSFFLQLFFDFCICIIINMAERTPDGAVWGFFLCAREMAKLHGLIRELRMPLLSRDDMVQMSFTQSFVTVLEVVAGDDLRISDLSVCSSFFGLMFLDLQCFFLILTSSL